METKLRLINEYLDTTTDITIVESLELTNEIINEFYLIEDTIDQVYNRKTADIEKKYLNKINSKIPGMKGMRNELAKDWRVDQLEKLNKWKEKYLSMNNKAKKNIIDKVRLGLTKAKPTTKRGLAIAGIGAAAIGAGYIAHRAFKKDKD